MVISIALLVSGCGTIKTKTDPDIIGQIPKTKNIVLRTTLVEYNEISIPQRHPPEINKTILGEVVEMIKEEFVARGYKVFNPNDKPDGAIINADLLVAYFEGVLGDRVFRSFLTCSFLRHVLSFIMRTIKQLL